ncbi:MAG: hypothetical protein R3B93_18530 [Bacteroidia bacterium]
MPPTPQFIVEQLCQFPQRAVNSKEKEEIFKKLSRFIQDENVEITQQPFRTPRHFIQILYWLFGGLITALLLSGYSPIIATILATFFTILGIRYFDWRSSWLTRFPTLIECFNFIAKKPLENPKVKLVFMAHWDTAPITIPYRPSMIKNLRSSVFIGVGIMILCVVVSILSIWMDANRLLNTLIKSGLQKLIPVDVMQVCYRQEAGRSRKINFDLQQDEFTGLAQKRRQFGMGIWREQCGPGCGWLRRYW